jgi:HK97 family phage major capsid protein
VPVQINNVTPTLLPPTITGPIFTHAVEQSSVMQLARRVPLSMNANTVVPVPMDVPTAGWVAEGAAKPVASSAVGIKTMTGKKVALLVPVSEEVVRTNPAGLYDQLQQDLPTAIGRAFDYAAIHGLDLKTGAAGPFADFLAKTPYAQVIGATTAANGGAYVDLVKGLQQVVNSPGGSWDFSGFAADPRLKPELMLSVDTQGRPLWVDQPQGGFNAASLLGYPAYYNSGVSGKYYRQGNTVQVVTIVGTPTGGTFTMTVGGATTSALAFGATGATVQTAIRLLAPAGNTSAATVTGAAGGPYTVTFVNGVGAPISVDQTLLTGGTAATSQATIAQSPVLDSGLRAVGGDFTQCAYGVGMDITIKISSEASYTPDGGTTWVSAFQNNLTLLLVEAYFGFVVGDLTAFCAYTHAAGS